MQWELDSLKTDRIRTAHTQAKILFKNISWLNPLVNLSNKEPAGLVEDIEITYQMKQMIL